MDATGETYTHRAWVAQAQAVLDALETLRNAADTMHASLASQEAGQSQLEGVRQWQAAVSTALATGEQLVTDTEQAQRPVGEAVATAGGPDEVAAKQYYSELG